MYESNDCTGVHIPRKVYNCWNMSELLLFWPKIVRLARIRCTGKLKWIAVYNYILSNQMASHKR